MLDVCVDAAGRCNGCLSNMSNELTYVKMLTRGLRAIAQPRSHSVHLRSQLRPSGDVNRFKVRLANLIISNLDACLNVSEPYYIS